MAQAYDSDVTTDSGDKPQGSGANGRFGRFRRYWAFGDGMWRRGIVTAVLAVAITVVMAFHGAVPNRVGNLGSLLETFLPWLGLGLPVLLAVGLLRRSATALIAVLLPTVVWLHFFGGLLTDKHTGGGDLTVVTHNVNADNPDPARTAQALVGSGADLVALEEIPAGKVAVYESGLKARYPYHARLGTVGLWSRYPLSQVRPVDIRLGWVRALRATAATPHGKVAVYVAHLPSVRVKFNAGFTAGERDRSADALGEAVADEKVPEVILMGDLNGTMNDRALANITSQMRSTQGAAGDGFGFSWPAGFPTARIDQILVRGAEPTDSWVLPATGSDHRPVAAKVALP
ncbi:endonuclease/exonuclease/phosphatase family protein [Actinacidiphila glaucinigra]|uniref:Vancomycin resistance protein VanJ n=2 Tax=Actinacidiphila glaucinigra TaxID=235986 RepID=A0A238ZJH3_9ACTN|nr:endonuclease/exonuclease/phosphatase family protein [Actinacidiphila glaucinigra]SNR83507.1 vancomycin resistance protein VanJ [Actinacidiphila glaucinigra]